MIGALGTRNPPKGASLETAVQKVTHDDLADFAESRVNMRQTDVEEERGQVNRLKDVLTEHIKRHPDIALVKIRNAGSLAKGTALRTINDVDIAVYLRATSAPESTPDLLAVLKSLLRQAYPNLRPDQFKTKLNCVTLSFVGTGLDVDVVPVLYDDGPGDTGYLVAKDTGDRVLTNVTQHIEFVRKRKAKYSRHYRQVIRFMKWWSRQNKLADPDFRCKSFMLELIVAHLFDRGIDASDYTHALSDVFAYIVKSGLRETIAFSDYCKLSDIPNDASPIRVYDPVNHQNNVVWRYTEADRIRLVEAANDALDAITYARFATTKGAAVEQWRTVFGPSFGAV
jgi:hypothetical protein